MLAPQQDTLKQPKREKKLQLLSQRPKKKSLLFALVQFQTPNHAGPKCHMNQDVISLRVNG